MIGLLFLFYQVCFSILYLRFFANLSFTDTLFMMIITLFFMVLIA